MRKYTSRNSTRYREKNGVRTKKTYPYYGCNNPNCAVPTIVSKKNLETAFEELLNQLQMPPTINEVITKLFDTCWQRHQHQSANLITEKKKNIDVLTLKLKQIEESLIRTSLPKLHEKLEAQWQSIEKQK